MFFTYDGQPGEAPFPLSIDSVKEIIERNKKGIEIEDLDQFTPEDTSEKDTDFAEVVGQDSLTRFDKNRSRSRGGRNRGRKNDSKGSADRGPKPQRPPQENRDSGTQQRPERSEQRGPSQRHKQGPPREGNAPRGDRGPRELKGNPPAQLPKPAEGNESRGDRQQRSGGDRRHTRNRGSKGNPYGGNQPPANSPS